MFFGEIYPIPEYYQAISVFFAGISCPARMLIASYVPFRVRHESEDAPGPVAYAGYVLDGAVRAMRITGASAFFIHIFEYDEPFFF